jgi:glycosyltransferase involved in cell wall biosynthesis
MLMKTKHLVSIIIPTYNRAHLIGETLDSIKNQTFTNWECIVVDDGSKDNIEELMDSYNAIDYRFRFISRPKSRSKGANACRNFGYENSNGEIIIWLDSDDLFVSEHLQIITEAHNEHPDKDAIVNEAGVFHTVIGDSDGKWFNAIPKGSLLDGFIEGDTAWQTAGVSWKRDSIPGEKPFNEKLKSSQEWTFHVNQILEGKTYLILEDSILFVRRHEKRVGKMVSSDKFKSSFLSRFIIYNKLKSSKKITPERERFLLKKMFQAAKKASLNKYDKLLLFFYWKFALIFPFSKRKFAILKIILLAIPLKRFLNSGERLFRV